MAHLLGSPDIYYGFSMVDTRRQRIAHSLSAVSKTMSRQTVTPQDIEDANISIGDYIKQLLEIIPRHPDNPTHAIEGKFIDKRQTSQYGLLRPRITTTLDAHKQRVILDARNAAYENGYSFTHSIDVSLQARNANRHMIREELRGSKYKLQAEPLREFSAADQLTVLDATRRVLGSLVMGIGKCDGHISFSLNDLYRERRVTERPDLAVPQDTTLKGRT